LQRILGPILIRNRCMQYLELQRRTCRSRHPYQTCSTCEDMKKGRSLETKSQRYRSSFSVDRTDLPFTDISLSLSGYRHGGKLVQIFCSSAKVSTTSRPVTLLSVNSSIAQFAIQSARYSIADRPRSASPSVRSHSLRENLK
jgi:hypothetical protein